MHERLATLCDHHPIPSGYVRYIFSCNYSRYLFASLRSFCPYFASSHVVQYMVVVAPGSGNAPAVTEEVALGMQALSRSGGVIVLRSL